MKTLTKIKYYEVKLFNPNSLTYSKLGKTSNKQNTIKELVKAGYKKENLLFIPKIEYRNINKCKLIKSKCDFADKQGNCTQPKISLELNCKR